MQITDRKISFALLLALFVSYSLPVFAQQAFHLKGTLVGAETDVFDPDHGSINVQGSGSGIATLLGRFALEYEIQVDLSSGSGPAHARLIAANGDILLLSGSGQASDSETPGVVNIHEVFSAVGGTGRFSGAAGQVIVDRVLLLATGVTNGSLDGTLRLP